MKRRILSIVTALALCLGLCPTWAFAVEGETDAANVPMLTDEHADYTEGDEASVTIGETTTYYTTLEEAFSAANGKTATITMLADAECTSDNGSPLSITGGTVTLNMDGHTLSGQGSGWSSGIIGVSGGSLTVQGNGTVQVSVRGVSCSGGALTIVGTKFNLVGNSYPAFFAIATIDGGSNAAPKVNISGGEIAGPAQDGQIYHAYGTTTINDVTATGTTKDNPIGVYYYDAGTLKINGGSFSNITVAGETSVSNVAGLLGSGVTYKYQNSTWATENDLAAMSIENVTVEKVPLTINPSAETSWYYNSGEHSLTMNAQPVAGETVTYEWSDGTNSLGCTADTYPVPADLAAGTYTYTCEATCDGYTLSRDFTFEIKQSGTEFKGDGVAKAYLGDVEQDTFVPDNFITVIATPTATGQAPTNAAMAASFDAPTGGQMALFVGNMQVSAPASANADGSYTMTVNASDVLAAAGEPGKVNLTAQFVGTASQTGAETTVEVTITAVAKVEIGSATTYYGSIETAWAAATGNTATITLLDNVTVSAPLAVTSGAITFDGGEYTLTCDNNKVSTFNVDGGALTIIDGTIISAYGVEISSGTLAVTGGKIEASQLGIMVTNANATVQLSGGTIAGGSHAVSSTSNNVKVSNFLLNCGTASEPHYAYYQGSTPVTSGLDQNELPAGTYTVAECEHDESACAYNPIAGTETHEKTCYACGMTWGAEPHADTNEDNRCDGCGEALAVKVDIGGIATCYTTIDAAWAAANGKTATITLLANVETTNALDVMNGANITFEGGSFTLTGTNSFYAISVGSGTLTVRSGTITGTGNKTITVSGGTLEVTGGEIQSGDEAGILAISGTVRISGGTIFSNTYALQRSESADIKISGGTFQGYTNAVYLSSGKVSDILMNYGDANAEKHYAFYKDGLPVSLTNETTLGMAPYTVKECHHEGVEFEPDEGSTTHSKICLACGYTETENCTYGDEYRHDETNHWQTCTVCGGQKSEAHTIGLTATVSGSTVTLRRGCATCGYGETVGTVTFDFPELTYGQTEGDLTWTAVPVGYTMELRIDDKAESIVSGESKNLAQLYGAGEKMPAGNHTLTVGFVDASGNESTKGELIFTVARAPLTADMVTLAEGRFVYTNEPQTPAVTVKQGETVLLEDTDYTVAYTNNINAGDEAAVTVSGQSNYTGSVVKTFTISKAKVTITWGGTAQSEVYSGSPAQIAAPTVSAEGGVTVSVTPEYSYAKQGEDTFVKGLPTDAGTYTVRASIEESGNLTAASADMTLTITRKPVTPTVTLPSDSFPYNGKEQTPAVTVKGGETVIPDSEYEVEYSNNINVGTATVTVKDKDGGNYAITQATEDFSITKVDQAVLSITSAPGSSTYGSEFQLNTSGGSGDGAVSWSASGANVDSSGKVTITTVGDVTITVTKAGDNNHNPATAEITINAAQRPIKITGMTGSTTKTYDGSTTCNGSGLTLTLENVVGDDAVIAKGVFVYDTADVGEGKTVTASSFTLEGGKAANYVIAADQASVSAQVGKIEKAEYKGTMTASTSAKFGTTATYDLTALLPAGATAGTSPTASGDIFEGDPSVSGKTLSYGLKADAAVGTTGTITVPVTSTNYKDFNLTITVTVSDKDVPTLTINPITVTYNGKPVPDTDIKGTAKVGDTTVSGTWNFVGTAPTNVADSGTKAVKFTPADPAKYAEVEGTVTVTINKATPTGAPKYTAISTSGKKLSDAGLTTEGGTFSVPGTVAWVLSADTEVKTNIDYEWVFTPTDSANYNTLTGKIRLWNYTQPSNPGGGNNYVPSNPGTSSLPVTTTGQNSSIVTTTTTAVPTASTSGGKATTTVDTAMGNEIVKQAVANKSEDIVIAPKVTGNVNRTEVSIPAATVGQIGSQTNASLTIATPVADVTIPNGGLGSLSSTSGTVTVTAEKSGNMVELSVTANGRTVDYVPGGLTLTVPAYTTSGTVAMLVNADGTREVVRKSVADNGSVTIPLDGSATLEIVDNSKYFYDVPSTSWAADAVAFASAHELFNGTGANQFSPDLPMSRGMLATVLHNLESNPYQPITSVFDDVNNSEWYAEGVAWAAAHGIVDGYGNGQFGPTDNITREQLAVMLWRYAGSPAATNRELYFADAYRASSWALEALRWATENGVMNGKGNGILDPGGQATRAETAQMLKNFMENQ